MSNSPFLFSDDEEENTPTFLGEDTASEVSADADEGDEEDEEGDNNRTFIIAAIVIGAIVLLSLLCIAGWVVFNGATATDQQASLNATIEAENTQIAGAALATQTALSLPTATATETLVPSATPLLATPEATSENPTETPDPMTATVAAAYTQAAGLALTSALTPSVTALADTGFADEVGLPGLLLAALALMIIILLARRLREAPLTTR
jgi:hypothetical protein